MAVQPLSKYDVTKIDELSGGEYKLFTDLIYEKAGISIKAGKNTMIAARLSKRLRHYGVSSFRDYIKIFQAPENYKERQMVVDLLTTNETYFFREPKHFAYLTTNVFPGMEKLPKVRVWSAASSSGEEPYTLAMLLDEKFGAGRWDLFASDISSRVLETAKKGVYPIDAQAKIPGHLLGRYCLKGVRSQEGCLLIDERLRNNMTFASVNLNETLPDNGMFDIIFLRNVLIYFNTETKRKVVEKLTRYLKKGGYFFVSHSETLNGLTDKLKSVGPSIYIKQ